MKRKWKVDYKTKENNFEKICDIKTNLIKGKLRENVLISYVLPVYKRADLLEKTLLCILNQQPVEFEWDIVIVDNEAGEENDTQRVVEKIDSDRIVYYRNEKNIGVDGNYNRCIELATGKWAAMIHGDDLIMDDHLKRSAEYIEYIENKKSTKELAYICHRYIDFSDESGIDLHREEEKAVSGKYKLELSEVYNGGRPVLQTQKLGVLTGYFASLPSFGTIMNKEIMIKEGGFNDNLGICEDVITPYRLAEKYEVYMAPVYMGFHRFDRNESMKVETILKIYAAMIEFREFMYTTVWWGKIWRFIARDILNDDLRNYCIGQSRFCSTELIRKDFDSICKVKKLNRIKNFFCNIVMKHVQKVNHLQSKKEYIKRCLMPSLGIIEENSKKKKGLLIYGAGATASELIPLLKESSSINLLGCVVSKEIQTKKIKGINVNYIDRYKSEAANVVVITATVLWEYQSQMNQRLEELGFKDFINLLN